MSRTEWILGVLLALLLIFILILGAIFFFQPGERRTEAPVAPTSQFAGQTAVEAYLSAQAEAVKWQPDAALVKASATWPQGADRATLLQGKTTWNFNYYSPASQTTAVVTVIDAVATLGSSRPAEAALAPVNVSAWSIDSHEAIQAMLRSGGDQFLELNGVSTLTVSLATDTAEGRTEWFLSLFAVSNGKSYTVTMDATSGEIINVIGTP
jgi:hypothetical protein